MTVQQDMERQLASAFSPDHLEVVNESHQHSVPTNSETHFKVTLVSGQFEGLRKVARHQRVYAVLADLLAGPVHALALHTYTGQEWHARRELAPASPECRGGSKADR
ncbi:BolA family protein [Pseudomonadota bacterium]